MLVPESLCPLLPIAILTASSLTLHPMPATPVAPTLSWFVSAEMLFAPARLVKDMPYDPWLYFLGEEISLAVRLWTH